MSDRGWLEWHFLEFDGKPVAGHMATRFGRSLVLLKIGYDENYSRLGPGNLLFHHIVARAFADDGIDEINCTTDKPWHANWQVVKDDYTDIMLTPPRLWPVVVGKVEVELPAAALRRAKEIDWLWRLARKSERLVRKTKAGLTRGDRSWFGRPH
jgi:hypothetical protein